MLYNSTKNILFQKGWKKGGEGGVILPKIHPLKGLAAQEIQEWKLLHRPCKLVGFTHPPNLHPYNPYRVCVGSIKKAEQCGPAWGLLILLPALFLL
jgi:hypothetical protein